MWWCQTDITAVMLSAPEFSGYYAKYCVHSVYFHFTFFFTFEMLIYNSVIQGVFLRHHTLKCRLLILAQSFHFVCIQHRISYEWLGSFLNHGWAQVDYLNESCLEQYLCKTSLINVCVCLMFVKYSLKHSHAILHNLFI